MRVAKLGEISLFVRNGKSVKQNDSLGGLPISRIETIAEGVINPQKVGFAGLGMEGNEEWLLIEGDILISHINSTKHLGKCAQYMGAPVKLIHGMNLLNLRCDQQVAYPRYVLHYLKSKTFLEQIPRITKNSVNQSSFTVSAFKELTILLPSLPEQKRIAAILDKADAIRRKREKAIELTDSFLNSMFLEMFGDLATNPKGWRIETLENLTTRITDGVHQKPNYTDSGIPFVSVKDISSGVLKLDKTKFISIEDHKKFTRRCKPEYLDILYTKVGTIGRPALVDTREEFSIYVSVALIKPRKEMINPFFLREVLATAALRRQANRSVKGIGVPDLHLVEIKKFLIPVPPQAIQQEFLTRVEGVHKLLDKQQRALLATQQLCLSLSQQLFRTKDGFTEPSSKAHVEVAHAL